MALSAQWRSRGDSDAILIVNDEDNTVREALSADSPVLLEVDVPVMMPPFQIVR